MLFVHMRRLNILSLELPQNLLKDQINRVTNGDRLATLGKMNPQTF